MNARTLTSNGAPIPFTPQYFGALRESHTGLPAETLRARYAEDGYVLLKGALASQTVFDLREAYFSLFDASFFKDGDARSGLFSGREPQGLPGHGLAGHPAYGFVRSDAFRAFTGAPTMKSIAETFFGGPAELIRRTPLRHFIPGRKRASRAHLDRTYIGGVAADVVTIWVPLGDCPIDAGALVYMDGSHEDAVLENARANAPNDRTDMRPITHDLKWLSDFSGRRWLYADYAAGDVVVHSPAIVHASLDGERDLMRVSTDVRFQRAGSPSDPRWRDDWSADDGY
ncbi:MAG: phytanoyl-CoA dioxygenase family protein [Rhodospirillaceae bacterium]